MSLVRTIVLLAVALAAQIASAAEDVPNPRQWRVNGLRREALVYVPPAPRNSRPNPAPLVFVFHGHGGTARNAVRQFALHEHWPEAAVVYMQGVPTPAKLVDPDGKKNGWQVHAGDFGDRDLHFFDAVLRSMRQDHLIDSDAIFATGHSNGGVFTYFLWAERGDVLAAVAPSAAFIPPDSLAKLKPKAVLHAAGRKDDLVKFAWQQEAIRNLIQLNGCSRDGQKVTPLVTRYPSKDADTPVLTYIHDGGHRLPEEEPAAIARFFRARANRAAE